MEIKVCGPGCAKCSEAEALIKAVVAEKGLAVEVSKVTDFKAIAQLGVFSTPAVVIDGQVKCVGKVPSKAEVVAWLQD